MTAVGLGDPTVRIPGVGRTGTRNLAAAGVHSVADLLWHLPHRYEDRSNPRTIASLVAPESSVTVCGRIARLSRRRARNRRLRIVEALLDDGTGAIGVVWFNQPYLATLLAPDRRVKNRHGGRGFFRLRPADRF